MRVSRYQFPIAAAVTVATTLGLAGCGGGTNSPPVASLSGSKSPSASTTTLPKGTPTALLDEWAACMRRNGDPQQTDPTIDSGGVIHVNMTGQTSGPVDIKQGACAPYLQGASTALGGGHNAADRPSYTKLLAFSKCMRSHGIPDFPDPSPGGGLSIQTHPGSDLDPRSPTFSAASKTCAKSTGVPGFGTGAGSPGAIQVNSTNGPGPGPSGGAGAGGSNNIVSGGGSQGLSTSGAGTGGA